jgi:hypothetical protein
MPVMFFFTQSTVVQVYVPQVGTVAGAGASGAGAGAPPLFTAAATVAPSKPTPAAAPPAMPTISPESYAPAADPMRQ